MKHLWSMLLRGRTQRQWQKAQRDWYDRYGEWNE